MNDLHEHLDELARTHDIPSGDASVVVERGRRRAQRRRRLTALAAAVAVVTTSAVVLTTRGEDETTLAADGGVSSTGDSGLVWQRAEPSSALALYGRGATFGGDTIYSLSTAPGQAPTDAIQPLRVWTSTDGVDWQDTDVPSDDIYLSDLEARDDRVYAIGTGQAAAATVRGQRVPELRVGRSDDGADSWATSTLDVDLAGIAEHATSVVWSQRMIAATGDAVVAVVSVRAELDVPELLPDGESAPNGWAITPTGVDVLGERTSEPCPEAKDSRATPEGDEPPPGRVWPDTCEKGEGQYETVPPQETHDVVRSYTWDELGVTGDLLAAALGRPIAFAADADASSFERVELPVPDGEVGWIGLVGGDGGFDVVVTPMGLDLGQSYLLHSVDGRAWTAMSSLPGDAQWISSMGHVGDRLVLQGVDIQNRPIVLVGGADGGWQVVRPADELDPDDVDGRQLFWTAGGVGDLGIVVVIGLSSKSESTPGDSEFVAFTSRDGTTWAHQSVDDLAGEHVTMVGGVVVTDDRIVLSTVPERGRDASGHVPQLALIATAA